MKWGHCAPPSAFTFSIHTHTHTRADSCLPFSVRARLSFKNVRLVIFTLWEVDSSSGNPVKGRPLNMTRAALGIQKIRRRLWISAESQAELQPSSNKTTWIHIQEVSESR